MLHHHCSLVGRRSGSFGRPINNECFSKRCTYSRREPQDKRAVVCSYQASTELARIRNSPATRDSGHPQVDWSRFHLQLLFVDTEDMGNARIAQGLFDSIAEWNGLGRTLYSWTCGTATTTYSPETAVSLMLRAENLGAPVKTFSRAPEQLEMQDLYTYDIIVAMNASVKAAALEIFDVDLAADWDCDDARAFYRQRVCALSDFLSYASNAQLAKRGASSLVPRTIADLVTPDVTRLRTLPDIPAPELKEVDAWNDMVKSILLGNAGLMQYVLDSYPDDLHYFWLE